MENELQNEKQKQQYIKMTETPIPSLLVSLSIPTIISMLISNIYNLVDTAFVGTLGNSASGAVGIVFSFMAIIQAIGFLFGQGGGSLVSRKLGEKKVEEATAYASTGFFTAFFLSALVAVICAFNLDFIVQALGSTKTIAPYAKTYIFYILLVAPFMTTTFSLNNFLRYEGKALLGMIGLLSGAVLNIAGDAILIFGFGMGIAGAGISTAASQMVSFCILISMFIAGRTQTRISISAFKMDISMIFDIITTGFPSLIRQVLASVATIILNMQAAVYQDAAVAAMSIVSRIGFFTFSVSLGIGQGFQPISAFNYGAKKYKRVREGFYTTLIMSEAALFILDVIVLIFASSIIQVFRNDPTVIEIGTRALILHAIGQLAVPFTMTTEMVMQSTGKKLGASLLSCARSGLIFIPLIIIMAKYRGLSGIQEAQPLAFVLSLIPGAIAAYLYLKKLPREK